MKRSLRSLIVLAPLLVRSVALAGDKPTWSALSAADPAAPPGPAAALAPLAFVASEDARRAVPTFLWAPGGGQKASAGALPEQAAREHLARHAARYGLTPAALASASAAAVHDTGRGGILVVLRQAVDGVEVFHQDAKVLMDRHLGLVAIGGNLHASAVPTAKHGGFRRSEDDAAAAALSDLYDAALAPSDVERGEALGLGYRAYRLAATEAARALGVRLLSPIRIKRVLFPMPGALVPAYFLEIDARARGARGNDAYGYVVAASDARVLYREDLTHADSFSYRVWADPAGDHRPKDGPLADDSPYPAAAPNGSYPPFAPPDLIAIDAFNKTHDPWLAPGATESRGNNVDAYTDDDMPDGFSPGDVRASTTSASTFDRVYDTGLGPQVNDNQRMASVTSVFYVTNWMHDWWYDSGFDEKSGNGQQNNYGRGGVEGDPLLAEAQNGAPTERDNSNMSAFSDGKSPRMQMFVWTGKQSASLSVQPGNLSPAVGVADFGPQSFSVSGSVVLLDDGTAPTSDACEPPINAAALAGNIALIDRGMCTFQSKVARAQAAGAVGVILADNKAGPPPPLSADPQSAAVAIPVLSITLADGDALKAQLGGAPTVTLSRSASPDLDGTLDNTVVAHEWAHYLHLRSVACGSHACSAESEGWADFNALMMVVREGDDLGGAFPLAQYATAAFPDDPAYFGIRRYPYSVDFTKNALTFRHISSGAPLPAGVPVAASSAQADNAEVHAAGEVWASMLFEAYVGLLKRASGATPAFSFDEGRRRMSDYVVLGMKLAPADPTFTEQRDALLAAAQANDPSDVAVLAAAFARRGAGSCAISPARDSLDLSGVVESFSLQPNTSITSIDIDDSVVSCDQDGTLDAGETGRITVKIKNASTVGLDSVSATIGSTTAGVSFPAGTQITFGPVSPFGSQTATAQIALDPSLKSLLHLDLSVTLSGAISCAASASLLVRPLANYDEITSGAAIDTVEARSTNWTLQGDSAAMIWARSETTPGNHVWAGVDYPSPSDTSLVSPPLPVGAAGHLVLSFKHRHQFEASSGAFFDGGVIELSSDGGASWVDISTFGTPSYEGLIGDPMNLAKNVLKGRQGYVGTNPSYPAMDTVKIDTGTALSGKTAQVRFRIGTDDASGGLGWQIDDIAVTGITDAPFSGVIDEKDTCGSGGSSGAAGAGGAGAGGVGAGLGGAGGSGAGQSAGAGHAGAGLGGAHAGGAGPGGGASAGGSGAPAGIAGTGGAHAGAAGMTGPAGGSGGAGDPAGHAGGPAGSAGHSHAGASGGSAGSADGALLADAAPGPTLDSVGAEGGGCSMPAAPQGAPGRVSAALFGLMAALRLRRRAPRRAARSGSRG